ncbi:hypothetical protein V6Z12_A10G089200 [Gossypium hirsutum]
MVISFNLLSQPVIAIFVLHPTDSYHLMSLFSMDGNIPWTVTIRYTYLYEGFSRVVRSLCI